MPEKSIASSSCREDEDTLEREKCWSEFPTDLLSFILGHLFLGDRCAFNAVCRSWSIIDTLPLTLPPPVDSPYFNSPCLMLSYQKISWKLFHPVYNNSYYLSFPEELLNAEICYSKYGWLLMYQDENKYFFFNPSTKVKIELPSTHSSFFQVCFTSPPTSEDNCVIFGIFSSRTLSDSEFGIIKLGETDWTVYPYSNACESELANCSPVFCNGLFYCLDQLGNLGVFDPCNEECHWVQYNKCRGKKLRRDQSYMAEVDGEILGVFVSREDERAGVYKLDLKEFVWNPLESLENKCLYVSPRVSFAETCVDKSLANKVYFNKFYGENGVVYSLSNKTYYSVGGGFASMAAHKLRDVRHGTWYRPASSELTDF